MSLTLPSAPIRLAKPIVNPVATNLCNKGATLANNSGLYLLTPFKKRLNSLSGREFSDKDKQLRTRIHQHVERQWRVSNARVSGDRDPVPAANLTYPILVLSFSPEMIVVLFDSHAGRAQRRWELSA